MSLPSSLPPYFRPATATEFTASRLPEALASKRYTIPIAVNPNPRIFLSAGEASGDHYGARLIAALKRHLPNATFTGLGGHEMRAAGQTQTVRAEDVAVMGITEILRHVPRIYASYRRLVATIRRHQPDVAVLIDFPDVNFRLAKHLQAAGVPVIWFVSPQLWAWKRSRLRWVQQRVSRMMVIFPFEETFYRHRGVDAEFVGHPLAEMPLPTCTREAYAAQYGLDPAKIWIALLPGSRWKEVRANLPALHELAVSDLIATQADATTFDGLELELPTTDTTRFEFLLPVASTISRSRLEALIAELESESLRYFAEAPSPQLLPRLVGGSEHGASAAETPTAPSLRPHLTLVADAREALFHASASAVASGTATVQAAVIGNPFVVVYRVSPLTFALARKLVRYPEEFPSTFHRTEPGDPDPPIAMVNLIAQYRLVPELLQERFTAENVAAALTPLLRDGPERARQLSGLAGVRQALKSRPGETSIDRVTTAVLRALALGIQASKLEIQN